MFSNSKLRTTWFAIRKPSIIYLAMLKLLLASFKLITHVDVVKYYHPLLFPTRPWLVAISVYPIIPGKATMTVRSLPLSAISTDNFGCFVTGNFEVCKV